MKITDDINELQASLTRRPEYTLNGTQTQVRTSILAFTYHPIRQDLGLRDYLFDLIQELNRAEGRVF